MSRPEALSNILLIRMPQAYAEGFEILQESWFDLDLERISHLWNQGSVVRSWLLELAEPAFGKNPGLQGIRGFVEDSGEMAKGI